MDAVNLQGVWLNFPLQRKAGGGGYVDGAGEIRRAVALGKEIAKKLRQQKDEEEIATILGIAE